MVNPEAQQIDTLKSKVSILNGEAASSLTKTSPATLESLALRATALEAQIGQLMAQGADVSALQGLLATVQAIAIAAQSAASEAKATQGRDGDEGKANDSQKSANQDNNTPADALKKGLLQKAEDMIASKDNDTRNAGHKLRATVRLVEKHGEALVEQALNPGQAMGDTAKKALEDGFLANDLQDEIVKSQQEESRKQADKYLETQAPEKKEEALTIREERKTEREEVAKGREALEQDDDMFGSLFAEAEEAAPMQAPKAEQKRSGPPYLDEAKNLGKTIVESGNNKAAERTGKPRSNEQQVGG
jgi:hypothetical protein